MKWRGRPTRIAILLAQPLVLGAIVSLREDSSRIRIATSVLVAMWVVAIGEIARRFMAARKHGSSGLAHLDALTAGGATTLLLADLALFASTKQAWASVTVLGVLGLGTVMLAVLWVGLAAGGDEPWRRATIERAILPAQAVEGEALREELRVCDVRIPTGCRLFAQGFTTMRLPITRYTIGSEGSLADVKLTSQLGAAHRGEHVAPAMRLWFGDLLGLARTPIVARGDATFVVAPKVPGIDGVTDLLGQGGDDQIAKPVIVLPTEGTFRTREYVTGDDTRRIHWVRSVNTGKLIVRLPDEVPASEPTVRLVLDTHVTDAYDLETTAPEEVLDAMVRVWLALGKSLVESGRRVILVTGSTKVVELPMMPRSREPVKLGSRVTWQTTVPLASMLDDTVSQIVVSARPRAVARGEAPKSLSWVVVPDGIWAAPAPLRPGNDLAVLAFPMGAAQNRGSRRAAERKRIEAIARDRAYFGQVACAIDWTVTGGGFVAQPIRENGRIKLAVIR